MGPVIEYQEDEQIYGIGVSLPLPLWDRKQGEMKQAKAERQKGEAEVEALRREIATSVTSAAKNLEQAREQQALYTPKFLDQLEKFAAEAESKYESGATTLVVFLDAKSTYFETMADYYESMANRAAAAVALEAAMGAPANLEPEQ
jgi:cobalt-zinc-cadmium efflux system outer membrane protein